MRKIKTPQERGFTIPVIRRLTDGRYQKAWIRSMETNSAGKVPVCFDSGRKSAWTPEDVIIETRGFVPVAQICCECGVDLTQGTHYLICSQSEI